MDRPLMDLIMQRARSARAEELQGVLTEIAAGALFIAHANGLPVGQMATQASMMALMADTQRAA